MEEGETPRMEKACVKEKILSIADMCATAITFILLRYKNPCGVRGEKAYLVYKEGGIVIVRRLHLRR